LLSSARPPKSTPSADLAAAPRSLVALFPAAAGTVLPDTIVATIGISVLIRKTRALPEATRIPQDQATASVAAMESTNRTVGTRAASVARVGRSSQATMATPRAYLALVVNTLMPTHIVAATTD
jgi:hypothetical protein